MFSTLRNRFGIPGVISVIALVFAMIGGAYATSNNAGGGATASAKKAAKGPRGPRGPKGATGAVGPAGPAGPQGPAGATGQNGAPGAPGKDGVNGKSVTVTEIEAGEEECEERGGALVQKEGAGSGVEVCNGAQGSPWTAGGTLPSGATQTGTFVFSERPTEAEEQLSTSLSFPIPLSQIDQETIGAFEFTETFQFKFPHIHVVTEANPALECSGTLDNPQASPGNLCIYAETAFEAVFLKLPATVGEPPLGVESPNGMPGVGRSGGILFGKAVDTSRLNIGGSWAVTAQ